MRHMVPLKPPKVKIRIIKPPTTNEEECLDRLVYLCPYCTSENIKFNGLDPIYTGSHVIKHTLGVIKRHSRGESYTCKSCGVVFGASTSKLHFSWLQFLKVWGAPIIFIILTIIFAQFWDVTTYVCGVISTIWVMINALGLLMDD